MTASDFNPYAHYQELMIPLRDGVRLAADVHFPVDDDGEAITDPAPVLLVRTSYDKSKDEWNTVRDYYPRHGYVFVNQDLRSRFKSEGDGRYYHTCNPWEGEDGFDTIEWIARQPWCNGKIGTLGSSHRGIVQTVAALHRPPHLTAQWVEQAPTNIYAHEAREGGAMCFHMAAAIHNHALDSHELRDNEEGVLAVAATFQNMREFLSNTPWKRGETALSHAPSLEETLFNYYTSGDYDEWWANENNDQTPYLDRHADIPVILTGGWWDPFAGGTADLFVDLTRRNKNPTHMVFGPWAHGTQRTDATLRGRCRLRARRAVGNVEIQSHTPPMVRPLAQRRTQRRRRRSPDPSLRNGRWRRHQERRRTPEPRRILANRARVAARPNAIDKLLPPRRRHP